MNSQSLQPLRWVHGEVPLWITPLQEIPGHALITSGDSRRWAVVRLSDHPWQDNAEFRRSAARAIPDILTLEPVRRITEDRFIVPSLSIRSLFLHITDECNLRCKHCFYMKDESEVPRRLSVGQIETMLDQSIPHGLTRVTLSGGEPLLHPEFGSILGLIKQRGLAGIVLTNGILLDEARCKCISAAGCSVLVSLHGSNAQIHERLTGAGTYTKAIDAIFLLLRHLPPARVIINCTLSEWNLNRIEEMVALADRLGVGRIRFMPLHRPRIRHDDQPALDYGSVKLHPWARTAPEGLVQRRWQANVSFGFTGLPGATCEEQEPADYLPCEIGRKLVVTADSGVYPCVLLMSNEFLLGRIEEGLDCMVTSSKLGNLVAMLQNRHRTVPRCADCTLGGICRGGCPALAWQTSGDFNQPDPLCECNRIFSANYFSLVTRRMMLS